ncbi:MAG: hypothetical protein SGI92_22925, partial [Bryobacteraceae bacterium]|nr:hypothetical protein [Bryobacteraceae bacterium]
MNKRQFLKQRRSSWREFEALLKRRKPEKVSSFSRLLRELSNDLATIRSRDWGQDLVDYLNALVARGHSAFYAAPPTNFSPIIRFLTVGFPQLFRSRISYFLVAAALFFVPGGLAWGVIQLNPALAPRLISPEQMEQFDAMYSERKHHDDEDDEAGTPWFRFGEERAAMAGFYVQHNVGIALQC